MKIIAAVSLNGVIGNKISNALPWGNEYPEDMQFFRKMTSGGTVIMGRNTFNSIGKALPKRRNIVISSNGYFIKAQHSNIEVYSSLEESLKKLNSDDNVWIIGGSFIYQEALKYVDMLYLTTIPETISKEESIYFPYVNPDQFKQTDRIELNKEKNLYCNVFKRI